MTPNLTPGDKATVTGPLRVTETTPGGCVFLKPGETVEVLEPANAEGSVFVQGNESGPRQYIAASSLTPVAD
ncbi:hypothetical protein [Mycolicibacterium komossense]|uniref:DUF1918 domain-containing protein n=1 Tax=Mycolicibacterium komossense TaxID=1779 RepID=A0ABT3C4P5_9MYCO|nr:hypothetical protein [Mycolicibacterium komossense]MCV7224453.1 hypothetical protein [Mycolicibacterium komossense]